MASIATALANMARMKDQLRCSGVVGAHTWRREATGTPVPRSTSHPGTRWQSEARGGAVSSDLEAVCGSNGIRGDDEAKGVLRRAILPAEVQVHPSDSPAEGEPVVSSGARERPARPARGLSSREGTRRSRSPSHDYWAEGHEDPGTVPQPNSPKARSARSGTGRLGGRGGDSASGPARTRRPQKASSKLEAQKRSSLASEVSAASENAPSVTDALMEREVSQASAASEKLPLSVEDEAASERRSLEESQRTTSAKDAQVLGDTAGRSSVTVMTYWLQVESIKGLPRLENAETVSLYEVHSYWMEQGGPMVRLAELQAHAADGGEECRVRNQVSLPLFEPAPGAGTVAVEVVRKVPENSKGSFMLVGRVELDALNDDTRRIASYALPPSAAVIKLRVCEHRAAVKASGGSYLAFSFAIGWCDFGLGAGSTFRVDSVAQGILVCVASAAGLLAEERAAGESKACMSLSPSEDLSALRKDLEALQDRVSVLEAQARSSRDSTPSTVVPVTVNYTQSGPADSAPSVSVLGPTQLPEAPTPGLTPGGRITASQYTEEYRRSIAQDIGDYFRRCLSGTNRGPSGRQQISLPSKVYILVRDLSGRLYDPVQVHHSFGSIRALVRDGDYLGDSIFVGFPTQWEARVAVERAGLHWQCAVLSSESGQLEPEYPLGFCEVTTSTGESERVAVICMGEMGGAFLVVTPHSAGHRQVAKRQLPSTFLSKPTSAEVLFAPSRDPGAHTVNSKVWFGWLSKDYESHISFDTASGPALTVLFDEDELMLPLASSLALAAERLFGLRAAPSSFESVPAEDTQVLGQRVAALENHLSGIKEQLEILIGQNTHPRTSGSPATQKAEGARPKSSAAPPRASQFLGLDPTVAQAALAAGIPATQLEEMSKLALAGKPRLPDLPKAPMPKRKDPLDESEDDAVGESAVEVTCGGIWGGGSYGGCYYPADRYHKTPGRSAEKGDITRSFARRLWLSRALKKTLSSDLEQISRVIERNMEADFNLRRSGVPGAPVVPVSARAWLEARSRVQNFRTPVTFLWGVAGILDALRDQKPEEARARAGLLLCQGDQLSIDRGSWIVAASMSLEDPPPFAVFATHTLPAETESQVTKLIDSRWVDLFLHHLSEIDQLAEKKKKLTFKKTPLDPPPDGTASPKRKGKGKGSGSAGSGKDAGREKEKEAAQSQDLAADAYPPRGEVRAGALLRQTHSSVKGPPSEIAEEAKPTVPAEAEKKPEHRAPGASASTVNARGLWNSLLRWVLRSPCGTLRTFLHTALHSPAPEGDLHDPRPEWPIPLPYPALLAGAREATEDDAWRRCANMMVLILNWIHMGQPAIWPRKFSIFSSLTPSQLVLVTRLKHLAGEWLKFKDITAESMGRTAGKVESLEALVHRLETSAVAFVPKSGSGNGPVHRAAAGEDTAVQVEDIQAAKAVEAGRLSFKGRPAFDPTPYLEEPARSLYQDPLKFAVPPSECFEEIPTVKVRGDRKEILGLLSSLDSTGRLALFSPDELRMDFRAGVFALMKNLTADRLILDCRPANALEPGLNQWTQTMGSLTPILGMRIPPDHKVVAAGEDLKDYYYYIISESRAKRNSLAFQLSRAEAKRFRGAYRWADRQARILIPALKTMAMGDLNAVEFGQQAHVKLGLLHGLVGMRDLLTLRGRFPRQSWAVGYVIDDFIVLEAVPKSSVPAPLFSSRLADAMVDVYSHVGLVANDSKRFRAEEHPQFWGISIDGNSGLVRALLDRTIPLSFVTARVARTGAASRHLLEIIAGSWTAIIAARKRCMCLLQQIFVEIQAHEYGVVFRISPQLVAELWTLVVLAPLMCSDLTAPTSTTLYAVDASDHRIAGVVTELTAPFAKELSRHTMTRAAWSRLLSPWKSHQRRLGRLDPADEVPEGEAPAQAHLLWVQLMRSCQFYPMFCDRAARSEHINVSEMRGLLKAEAHHSSEQPSTRCNIGTDSQVCLEAVVKGRASSVVLNKMLRRHLPVLLCGNLYPGHQYLPSSDNPADDPTRDKELREPVETAPKWLVEAFEGDFRSLDDMLKASSADEATLARLPEFEDSAIPPDWLRSDRQLLRRDYRNRHCSAEHRTAVTGLPNNPAPDLWKTEDQVKLHPAAEQLLRKLPESYFVFPKSWNRKQRRTSLSFTGALDLFSGSRGLSGYSRKHRKPWTKVAEAYPAKLCGALALVLANQLLPPSRQRKLDLAACAHVNSRVGEASKPGPRPRRPRPAVDLEEVQLVTAHTSFIQQKARALFAAWLATELSEATWRNLEDLPELCVIFLRAFGRHLFASSQPLYLFRHLVVYFQRNYPVFPAPLSEAWDLIARWERIQPVEHRTPMPKLIFDAVVSLAYLWGWYRFAAVTLLAFHGKLRISEPLKAARKDLLLPAETGVGLDAAFLNIEKSKTSFRGKGIVQHTKITDGNALAAADRILKTLSPEERLYAGTPSTYRRRWDALLRSLQIDKSWQLTPGTLRSGGAIYAYHSGVPVTEILWLMRLKNLTTLESYLQSTGEVLNRLKSGRVEGTDRKDPGSKGAQSLVQVLGEAKAEPRLNEGSVKVTERAEPDAPSQSKQVPEAVEEADEYIYTEEGEEEEIIEDDPIVS
ncbi:Ankyrin-3 [Durusdinium trenchii]|uniref:Ankyrin-3 n=1 Tax=Durusdinium trenchii TaxID=1381693 RepID=A0ABP0J7K9_9DINO